MTTCSDCEFGVPVLGGIPQHFGPMFECRFHVPRPFVGRLTDPCDRITQPSIQPADYWCGGWKPKEKPLSFDLGLKEIDHGYPYDIDKNKPVTYDDPFDA